MLKSIVCTYPDFRTLPKGIKQMLVASENIFFSEVQVSSVRKEGREPSRNFWQPPQQQLSANGYAAFSA